MRVLLPLLTAGTVLVSASASAQQIDWQQVDAVFGRKPAVSDDVHRYGFPRTDLSVTLEASQSSQPWRWVVGSPSSQRMAAPW